MVRRKDFLNFGGEATNPANSMITGQHLERHYCFMFNDSLAIYTMKETNKKKLEDGGIVAGGNLILILGQLSFHMHEYRTCTLKRKKVL